MMRVANNDPTLIKQALDTGALGVVGPMAMDGQEATEAARAARYPPSGSRSVALGCRAALYGEDYVERANDGVAVIVQIEHIDAVARAEEILTVPGVDMGFLGPNDLAWSMGVEPGSVEHEVAIADALAVARRVGRPLGLLTADGAAARARPTGLPVRRGRLGLDLHEGRGRTVSTNGSGRVTRVGDDTSGSVEP